MSDTKGRRARGRARQERERKIACESVIEKEGGQLQTRPADEA